MKSISYLRVWSMYTKSSLITLDVEASTAKKIKNKLNKQSNDNKPHKCCIGTNIITMDLGIQKKNRRCWIIIL